MNRFTNTEFADIHLKYGLANGNGLAAARLYLERFPTMPVPNHQTLTYAHQNLSEHGFITVPMQHTSSLDVDGLGVVVPSHGRPRLRESSPRFFSEVP
ncbi:hypothetical protein AVEN_53368-1 [Araneus ventricosus]|uniref:DUF4817 domain-containing protein n=1 Tax=Araneus ventricosus TaxID=182803 RepID=A0A4Y2AA77_ARAVE|nr:hypothetical protein AVEN_53368-1 [Araneus ventricosus]